MSSSFRLFVSLFEFGNGFLSQELIGAAVFLGVGSFIQRGKCKEGCGFQKPRAFWSAVQTADQKNSRKSCTVLFLLIPDNADTIC